MVNVLKYGTKKENIRLLLERLSKQEKKKGIDAYKYCGLIKLKKNPLTIQKELRNEWE